MPEDLKDPQRRVDLHKDACRIGVIGNNPADLLKFYAAIARARRLGTHNLCGMLRRSIQTTTYHGYITDYDKGRARAWLRELEPQPTPEVLAPVSAGSDRLRADRRPGVPRPGPGPHEEWK